MTPNGPQYYAGQLTVSQLMSTRPAVVPVGTSLLEVADALSSHHYRHALVTGTDGRIVGVVSSNDLLRHMADWNYDDTDAWQRKTVDAVMTTKFIASAPGADAQDVAPLITSRSLECVPVVEDGRLVGVLTTDDLLLSWRRVDPVLREAATDAITELPNRATFNRRLREEWDRARRTLAPLGLMIIDVDHFKQVNDVCGHPAGDAVLHIIGSCLRRHLRTYDVVARYAGDEFAAICCGCRPEDVDAPVRRLQQAVRNLSIPTQFTPRQITLSIGVAVITDGFASSSMEELVAAADASLYQSKRAGRDRAHCVQIGPGSGPGGTRELASPRVPIQALIGAPE